MSVEKRNRLGRAVAVVAMMVGTSGTAPAAGKEAPLVVFVCEHGSAKSLVAASFFDRLAKERGLAARAVARGTAPDDSVPTAVVELLRGDGFAVATFQPRALKAAEVAVAVRVVAIGADLGKLGTEAGTRLQRWDDVPPFAQGYSLARSVIVAHVEALLRDLEREGKRP
jgi:arsenate reductase (thioredoxin)